VPFFDLALGLDHAIEGLDFDRRRPLVQVVAPHDVTAYTGLAQHHAPTHDHVLSLSEGLQGAVAEEDLGLPGLEVGFLLQVDRFQEVFDLRES